MHSDFDLTRLRRHLAAFAAIVIASLLVVAIIRVFGLSHDARIVLSACVLGPVAAVIAAITLRLHRRRQS
jgi:hypothetical protein